jgi:SNF2 family DNA or RNA helicase
MLDFNTHAHSYQRKGAEHLWNSTATGGVATLWLDPGYGKTMIVLHAFKALYDAGLVKTMLIVAPLRVAQTVWAQEIEEWASLKGLVAQRLHGPKKETWLKKRDVNVWIINYEGIPWAVKMARAGKLPPLDVICFDEVRRMKNSQGKRFKAARPLVRLAKYKWGLTGTPVSNGLMDLFGQFLILDEGLALGKYITKYRQNYFEQGYDGFTWLPRPGAKEKIEERVAPYVFRAEGFLDLPEFVDAQIRVPLPAATKKKYDELKKHMIAELEGDKLTAANAAVLVGKLKQIANGRVYDNDGNVIEVHEAKKEALEELVEELGDEQLLIAYEYNHDLAQLRDFFGEDLPYLGAGVNERTAMAHVDGWNKGEIRVLAAHPASAGHGLNLQKSGAHHILWFGPTVDLDHYIQFNRRLLRQGNQASHVVVHTFVAENTVDEAVIVSRLEKDGLQSSVLKALTAEFGELTVEGEIKPQEDQTMTNLQFKNDAQQQPQGGNPFAQAAPTPQPAPAAPTPTPTQASNPFAAGSQAPAQTQPAQAAQPAPAPANPFAPTPPQNNGGQIAEIEQTVAAQPVPQPDPASAPPNPFAGQAAPAAPVEQNVEAPVAAPQSPVEAPAVEAPAVETPAESAAQVGDVTEAQTPRLTEVVPINIMVPLDKLDKVMSAIGRAVK